MRFQFIKGKPLVALTRCVYNDVLSQDASHFLYVTFPPAQIQNGGLSYAAQPQMRRRRGFACFESPVPVLTKYFNTFEYLTSAKETVFSFITYTNYEHVFPIKHELQIQSLGLGLGIWASFLGWSDVEFQRFDYKKKTEASSSLKPKHPPLIVKVQNTFLVFNYST